MRLPRSLEWIVRRAAGANDAESIVADLECEADERARSAGAAAARRWLRRQVFRSAPTLLRRRATLAMHVVMRGPAMFYRGFWLDLQMIGRRLRRSPGFAALAIAMLGLGIGAATSVFNLAYTIWLKPLGYQAADRLVKITSTQRDAGLHTGLSSPELQDVVDNVPGIDGIASYSYGAFMARFGDEPARVAAASVSTNLFSVLGVSPQLGRSFAADDEGRDVVVISDAFWRTRFHADPHVVGAILGGRAEHYTIVGVMPRDFTFPLFLNADGWIPSVRNMADRDRRASEVVARLAPNATIGSVNAELASLSARLAVAYPVTNARWTMAAEPYDDTSGYRAAFVTLLAMVGLFLAIACANLANLFVARNLARRHELTVALAIGAPRWRLARLALLESALLSAVGAGVGLLFTLEMTTLFQHWLPQSTARLGNLRVDRVVLLAAIGTAACTTALCALAPIAGLRRLRIAESFSGARAIGGPSNRGQHVLVVSEVALAALLLVGGGCMVHSFNQLLDRDRGYVPQGVVALTVSLPYDDDQYLQPAVRVDAFRRLVEGIQGVAGVNAAGAATGFPGSSLGSLGSRVVNVSGHNGPPVTATLHDATPDYFRAMGVPIVSGRAFVNEDTGTSRRVVIINQTMARALFPDGQSVGRQFTVGAPKGLVNGTETDAEVIGVVADMHLGARRSADMFVPLTQVPSFWADVVVRTSGDPDTIAETVRQSIRRTNPDAVVEHVSPLQTIIANAYGLERAQSFLTALVAALGGAIALMGLYALLNQFVAMRTREIGIRLALGSSPQRAFWAMFQRGMRLSIAGVAIGVGVALMAARILRGQVFGLDAASLWLFLPIAGLLVVASAVVISASARRVTTIDPLVALRQI